jgi:hypothetical protein
VECGPTLGAFAIGFCLFLEQQIHYLYLVTSGR